MGFAVFVRQRAFGVRRLTVNASCAIFRAYTHIWTPLALKRGPRGRNGPEVEVKRVGSFDARRCRVCAGEVAQHPATWRQLGVQVSP